MLNVIRSCAVFAVCLLSACSDATSDSSGGKTQGVSAPSNKMVSAITTLDDEYRAPMIGRWRLERQIFLDGTEMPDPNGMIVFNADGTYERDRAWEGDSRAGDWSLNYASMPDGSIRRLLYLHDRTRNRGRYWDRHVFFVTFAVDKGSPLLVLTKHDGGDKYVFSVATELVEH